MNKKNLPGPGHGFAWIFLMFFISQFFILSYGYAQSILRYVPGKELAKEIMLENESIQYIISISNMVNLSRAVIKSTGRDFFADNQPLAFTSARLSLWLDDVGYQLFTVSDRKAGDRITVEITQQSKYVENSAIVTQSFSLGPSTELEWEVTVFNSATGGRSYRAPRTRTTNITFPVMQKLKLGNESDMHYLIPTQRRFFCIDDPDVFIFYFAQPHDPKMPISIYNEREDAGIYFHILNTVFDWDFANKDDFRAKIFPLTQKPGEKTKVLQCRICAHSGDWHVAFNAFKSYVRSTFDFQYYQRPIQEKYRQRFVSHFTFLYGHDIYDPETNQFQIDRFLDEGELNFGGYDYMLAWHDYPHMGIDDRDQFDMYEDLPGGLAGLKKMVDKAHARNVQVFIPYKPWDIMKGRKDHFKQEVRIAQAIGADGIFLDTMSESDLAFRHALDTVNPDNVFVSEGRPDLQAARLVTGSWNQQGDATNKMPNVDLFRFIIPEHNVHNINRGVRQRDELVYNALFNGTGFIVWEDIFGEINKYSWNERILIRRYNRIIHENRDAYLTENPVPLVNSLRKDLFINKFPARDKCVYPVYQFGREKVNRAIDNRLIGPFIEVNHPDNWHFVDVWNHQVIPVEKKSGTTRLVFPEEPTDVMSCIVGMPENLQVQKSGDVLQISLKNPLKNSSIQITTVNNLTMMEQEALTLEGSGGEVDLAKIDLKFPYQILVKLMQGDILKDEVILYMGWKQFN